MIEPVSTSIGALVAAVAARSQAKALDATVDYGTSCFNNLIDRLRNLLRSTDDEDTRERKLLEQVLEVPDSPSRLNALAEALDARTAQQPDLQAALEQFLADAASHGIDVSAISQTVHGNLNVQAANVTNSSVNVNHGTPRG